jgi:hypothetical protein
LTVHVRAGDKVDVHRFQGFRKTDQDGVAAAARSKLGKELEVSALSTKAFNWGALALADGVIRFAVGDAAAFDVPLGVVSQAQVQGPTELALTFRQDEVRRCARVRGARAC